MLKMAFPVQIDEYGDVYGYSRGAETMYGIATLVSLVWIILTIIWAFRARAALQQYALTQFRFELKMNPVWTFLFHIFYINYCINAMPESLAKHRIIYGEPDSRPGITHLSNISFAFISLLAPPTGGVFSDFFCRAYVLFTIRRPFLSRAGGCHHNSLSQCVYRK